MSDGWGIYGIPNGGYLMFLAAKALGEVLELPDALTATAHFARPSQPGPAEVHTEVIKRGRTLSSGVARVLQDGKERFRVTASFGDLEALEGASREASETPPIPLPEECVEIVGAPPGSTYGERVETRYVPGSVPFLEGKSGPMGLGGWIRFADGRAPDALSLLLFADAWPPPVLNAVEERAWVPTVELTVQVRRRPAPGWIKGWFETRHLVDGGLEEDGRLWDAEGQLVALSRQYARLLRG